jgi:hypothetical protein
MNITEALTMARQQRVRHHVIHDYHDHSQDLPGMEFFETAHISPADAEFNRTGSLDNMLQCIKLDTKLKFPLKLHKLLDDAEMNGFADIICWRIHGRAFVIHNSKEFCLRVIPLYFNQSKITSFLRQLNLYGFLRITHGRDEGSYYHELFLRGKPFLVKQMLRQKVKGTKVRGLSSPETEPNFYAMPYVPVPLKCSSGSSVSKITSCSSNLRTCSQSFTKFPDKNKAHDVNEQSVHEITIKLHESEESSTMKSSPVQQVICKDFSEEFDDSNIFFWEGELADDSSFDFTFACEEDSFTESSRHLPDDFSLKSDLLDHLLVDDEWSNSSTQRFSFHEGKILLALAHNNEYRFADNRSS